MRIPREDRPTPWFNRRDQYRMLAMVGLLCLVMAAMMYAARPQTWYWLVPPSGDETTTKKSDEQVSLKELDFRVHNQSREPLPPGVFRAVATVDETSADAEATPVGDDKPTSRESADVAIPPELLTGIEDNTLGVRSAEADAYLTMLERVRRLPNAVLNEQAADDVAFTVIMQQPEDYRGRLISVTGWLHRLTEYPVLTNDRGIDRLYEGWLFTDDSGNNPWRFLCTALPPGVPLGEEIEQVKVRVVGYFFKRMGYASQGGQHVAPTLLAGTFEVLPVPDSIAPQMQAEMRNWMLGFVGLLIVALAVLMWWFMRSDRKYAGSRLHELAVSRLDADASDLAALKDVETYDPSTYFAEGPQESETSSGD